MQNQPVTARQSHAKRAGICAAAGWFVLALFPVQSVEAAALSNKDTSAYKIEVISKGGRREHELSPGKSITEFCKVGCIIRLNSDAANDYELEGSERVSIEGGLVYYDGEEIPKSADASGQTK